MYTKTIRKYQLRMVLGLLIVVSLGLLLSVQQVSAAKNKGNDAPPDYTKGEYPADDTDSGAWALGSTGAFGTFWYSAPRMIQISRVDAGTPAAGKLKQCDVILGVISPKVSPPATGTHTPSLPAANPPRSSEDPKDPLSRGVPDVSRRSGAETDGRGVFTADAHRVLSSAITEAEKSNGKLVLTVWRPVTKTEIKDRGKKGKVSILVVVKPVSGQTMQVTLDLPVKGAYSATAPWNCEKSKALVSDAAESIAKRELKGGFVENLDALGLLATGEKKYLPQVAKLARQQAKACEEFDIMGGSGTSSWQGGYLNLFLTEYYLLTKDEAVLPGIKALSEYLAYGQSGVGTWSHGMADVQAHGLYGPSAVYGSMNQCSLVCALSLVLAQKCGITTQPVNDAVNRSRKFYRYYVDKGCIPYGEHPPAHHHDNNGRNSIAAVFFDLLGDKEATKYFARMTLASSNNREGGHTGHFFAWQWGALGASRGGPAAAQAFVARTRYFTELERRADGSSVYQPMLRGGNKYIGNSTTGQRLMQNCLPRKVLYITGKVDSCIPPFTREEVKDAVDAGMFDPKGLPVKELMAKLGSWSLIVRGSAAEELGTREDNVVEELIAMLDSPNRYARYGAATALQSCGRNSEKAVDALVNKIENDKDMTLRFFAVNALKIPDRQPSPNGLGAASKKSVPALLRIAAAYDPEQDPNRMTSGQMAGMFFYSGSVQGFRGFFPDGKGTENLDRKLLIPAMKAFLVNPDGGARSTAATVFDKLKEEDLNQLWPEIYFAAKYQAPANAMFANGVRANGIRLMAQNRFEEVLPMALEYLYQRGWGKFGRVPPAFDALSNYGSLMKPHLEEMRTKEYEPYIKGRKPKEVEGCKKAWQKVLGNIDKNVELRSIKPFLDKSGMKEPVKVFPPNKDGSPRKVVQAKEGEEEAQTPEEFKPKEGGGGE